MSDFINTDEFTEFTVKKINGKAAVEQITNSRY